MKQLTPSQKKILVYASIIIAVFLLLWLSVYAPVENRITKIKSELQGIDGEIKNAAAMSGKSAITGVDIVSLQNKLKRLNAQFLKQEEGILQALSGIAQKLNIERLHMRADSRVPLTDDKRQPLLIGGKQLEVINVSFALRCTYRDFIRYLETIKKEVTALLTIERLNLARSSSMSQQWSIEPLLDITMDLRLYVEQK